MTTTTSRFRYIGITDECTTCEHCDKAGLRSTVILALLDADGTEEAVVRYGTTCAARALDVRGGARAVRQSAEWATTRTREAAKEARRMLARYQVAEDGEILHPRGFNGVAIAYRYDNLGALADMTWEQQKEAARDMVTRKLAAIAEARLIGA